MAESLVNTTEGSGKKLHTYQRTIGANNVEDEIALIGDQYLATYNASTAGVSAATANDHLIQIMAGSTLHVQIRRILVYQSALATTAAFANLQVLRLTTAGTGGTATTPAVYDPNDAGSGATAMSLPTAKGTEGTRLWNGSVGFTQTVPTAGISPALLDLDFDKNPRLKPIRIAPGTTNGICLKNLTAIAAATVIVDVFFTESNFQM